MRRLGFDIMFKEIKSKGIDLFTFVTGLMVHSMDEDNSLAATAQWMSNPVVKSIYGIPEDDNMSQKTLNRSLEALGPTTRRSWSDRTRASDVSPPVRTTTP